MTDTWKCELFLHNVNFTQVQKSHQRMTDIKDTAATMSHSLQCPVWLLCVSTLTAIKYETSQICFLCESLLGQRGCIKSKNLLQTCADPNFSEL